MFQKSSSKRFFLEAGAWDGEHLSNSLQLEYRRGWTGLLVEPAPEAYRALREKRRRAWTSPACLSIEKHPVWVDFDVAGVLGRTKDLAYDRPLLIFSYTRRN